MARMATLEQVKEQNLIPGISFNELYNGLRSGRYPGYRVGGPRGRWVVDLDMIEKRIQELMIENLKKSEQENQYGQLRKIF